MVQSHHDVREVDQAEEYSRPGRGMAAALMEEHSRAAGETGEVLAEQKTPAADTVMEEDLVEEHTCSADESEVDRTGEHMSVDDTDSPTRTKSRRFHCIYREWPNSSHLVGVVAGIAAEQDAEPAAVPGHRSCHLCRRNTS